MDGILIIDKPEKLTSHDVVARLRRILKTKRIGHTGTLDPFATGVLVMLVGKATRLAQFLDKDKKEYEAVVSFGYSTDTGDRTGAPKPVSDSRFQIPDSRFQITNEEIENALKSFRGEIEQTPPMYSAKKIDGVKLYELARKGIEIEREAVKIIIYNLEMISSPRRSAANKIESPTADKNFGIWNLEFGIRISCSAGTYIRTLAEDIGKQLETGAHLAELRRTKAGKFDLSQAATIEELELIVSENRLPEVLISMNEAVSHLPQVVLNEKEIEDTKNGKRLRIENVALADNQTVRMNDGADNLMAIGFYKAEEKSIQPKLVLI